MSPEVTVSVDALFLTMAVILVGMYLAGIATAIGCIWLMDYLDRRSGLV